MINNLKGKSIGVFKVLEDSGKRRFGGNILWKIICKLCNNEKLLTHDEMKTNQSCGCISRELQSKSMRKSLNRGGYKEIYASHWNVLKKNANKRNLQFNLNIKYIWKLFLKQNRKCALTGEPIKFHSKCWSHDATASLDRIDSTKGYVKGNVQWVHKDINFMKQEYSTENFIGWCKKIVEYNKL